MPITPDMLIGMYRGLVAEDPAQRGDQADSVTDIYRSMSDAQVHGVALLLAALAVWESDAVAREAQLNALSELHAFDRTTADAIELLRLIDPNTLSGSQIEHFADILNINLKRQGFWRVRRYHPAEAIRSISGLSRMLQPIR